MRIKNLMHADTAVSLTSAASAAQTLSGEGGPEVSAAGSSGEADVDASTVPTTILQHKWANLTYRSYQNQRKPWCGYFIHPDTGAVRILLNILPELESKQSVAVPQQERLQNGL
jgi:hypothetical protein